ncbi:unnamed protein product [Peronospora farinosa]|uniref:Uncharacterized protein n=1 Tax=Peronospora farinosa TaxID=134698 RepID=A0ABN8CE19_9STRA|nr:unnamed protein product [Peronospora farinosa]
MPMLKRLLRKEELDESMENMTAEQLFASSIYSQEMKIQRQQVAAICTASFVMMSTLARQEKATSSVIGHSNYRAETCDINVCRVFLECVEAALQVTRGGKKVLFLVRDPKFVTKKLAVAVSNPAAAMTTEIAAKCLHQIHFRQCRSIYELLRELDHVEKSSLEMQDTQRIHLVILGPLCELLSGFQTVSGMTVTGAGFKRMVELAVKRLQTLPNIYVSVIKT